MWFYCKGKNWVTWNKFTFVVCHVNVTLNFSNDSSMVQSLKATTRGRDPQWVHLVRLCGYHSTGCKGVICDLDSSNVTGFPGRDSPLTGAHNGLLPLMRPLIPASRASTFSCQGSGSSLSPTSTYHVTNNLSYSDISLLPVQATRPKIFPDAI